MPSNSRYPLLDSFGLEFETVAQRRGNLPRDLRNYFAEDHDASIETPNLKVNPDSTNQFFEDPDNILEFPRATAGSEIVSTVLNIESLEHKKAIERLCGYLSENGEPCETDRAGIHVHISMGYTLPILKNLTKLMSHLEQVFYYVGGMGYEFRGLKNSFTYCRPVTQYGPSVIRTEKGFIQAFSIKDLLSSTSVTQFFNRYGGIVLDNPPGKYYPIRYNWFTLYPLLTKGTVEFRVYNTTLNPMYIWSAILLSRKMCQLALSDKEIPDLPENSIYSEHSKEHVLSTFVDFANRMEMDDLTARTIVYIISRTPEIRPEPEYVLSHLDGRFSTNYSTMPKTLPSNAKIVTPNFVDSHRLEREGINGNNRREPANILERMEIRRRNSIREIEENTPRPMPTDFWEEIQPFENSNNDEEIH